MDFDLTDEQRLLADTVTDLLDKRYDANARLKLLESDLGWSRDMWQQYAQLGLLGLAFDEQYGGAGMGADELAVVMDCFGRALVLEPFLSTVVVGGGLVAAAGTPEQKSEILPKIADGALLLAFAHTETSSRWSLADVSTSASQDGERWKLTGEKIAVAGGDSADRLIVSARTPEGIGLFLVDGGDTTRAGYPMQDGIRGADIRLQDTTATLLGAETNASDVIASVVETATVALCSEAVGAMDRMLRMTVDYLKTREQFGHPIAVFQALQFRAADMFVALEQARSMALLARLALSNDDRDERRRIVQAAKAHIDLAARAIGQDAVQLHGGIGMTMEYPVGHYLKRTTVIAKTFADTATLLEQIGAAGGLFIAAR